MQTLIIDKLGYILVKDRKTLVTMSHGNDIWYTPGGKREGKETDEQALIREVKEELSVNIIPETIKHYGVFQAQAHGKPEGTVVRIAGYTADYKGELTASSEVAKIGWIDSRTKNISAAGLLILKDLKYKNLID